MITYRDDSYRPPDRILDHYDRLLIVSHPTVTNRHRADRQIKRLAEIDHGLEVEVIESSANQTVTEERVRQHLTDRTIVAKATGDGGVEGGLRAIIGTPAALWKMRAGDGDNLGRESFPLRHRSNVRRILASGRIASAKALSIKIESSDGSREAVLATDNFSVGDSAASARAINRPDHRQKRQTMSAARQLLFDAQATIKAVKQNQPLVIEVEGRPWILNELMIANLGKFARIGHLKVRLEEPRLLLTAVKYESNLEARLKAVGLLFGRLSGRYLEEGQNFNFTALSPAVWQAGGDDHDLKPGDKVTVGQTDDSFNYITMRPGPPARQTI